MAKQFFKGMIGVLVGLSWCVTAHAAEKIFATVGEEFITQAEYEAHVEAGLRQKFYHGKVPAAQLLVFRQEMAPELIDRVLLVQEARRRGLQIQAEQVDVIVAQTRQRYRHNPAWKKQGKAILVQLRRGVERRDLIAQLRQTVMFKQGQLETPAVASVKAYYRENKDKFTTPERLHLGLIMLAVEAWASTAKWQAAEAEAARLVQRLRAGKADFAALARLHSSDESAQKGGDLGYVHQGMLSREAQQHVAGLAVGAVSAPLRLLQGVAIFRLQARQAAQLNPFEQVRERAGGLLQRQRQRRAWLQLLEDLRLKTMVQRVDSMITNDG